MKNLIIFLPIIAFSILETTIIPLHLTLIIVVLWASLRLFDEALTVAFLAGLTIDLLSGKTLGQTSLVFLILAFCIILYKNRFHADKLRFLLPFSVIAIVPNDMFFGLVSWSNFMWELVLLAVLFPLMRRFFTRSEDIYQAKLSFDLPSKRQTR